MSPTRTPGSSMDTKQKAIIGIMTLVVIVVIWQVIGLFGGGGKTAPAPITTAASTTKTVTTHPMANALSANAPSMEATTNGGANSQQLMTKPQSAPVQNNNEILKLQKDSEEKYLANLNQLQMLKLQQQIAETNQAIATAKLSTVTSEKNIADMLTKPAPAPIPEGVYANTLAGSPPPAAVPSATATVPVATVTTTTVTTRPDAIYLVLSVAEQGHKWSAVVGGSGGKLYNVTIGDILRDDGSKVVSINQNGIMLEKDGKKRTVSLTNSV